MSDLIKYGTTRNTLAGYASGAASVPFRDRAVAAAAKRDYDEARLTTFKTEASVAVAGHAMQQVAGLHQLRNELASDDPALQMVLGGIMGNAVAQVTLIQARLFASQWGF